MRLLLVLWLALALPPLFAEVALGGSYTVRSCADSVGAPQNLSWTFASNAAAQVEAEGVCERGLTVRERLLPPDSGPGTFGYWTLASPETTRIRSLVLSRSLQTFGNEGWRSVIAADGSDLEACQLPPGPEIECAKGGRETGSAGFQIDASTVSIGIRCAAPPGGVCTHGESIHSAVATLYGATVTIEDPVAPGLGQLGGTALAGGWLRGPVLVAAGGSDATGIKRFEVLREDGEVIGRAERFCDFGRTVPCAPGGQTVPSGDFGVDTTKLADGVQRVRVRVVDSAENATDSAPIEVKVDNTPPAAPKRVRNGRGAVWAARSLQAVRWTASGGEVSPVTGSTVSACRTPQDCIEVGGSGPTGATVTLPRQGLYRGSVSLTDEAGNVGAAAPLRIGFDRSAPRRPRIGRVTRAMSRRTVRVRLRKDRGPSGNARLAVRICRTATRGCRTVKTRGTRRVRVRLTSDGRRVLRVQAVDAAGNRSRAAVRRLR